MAVFSGREYRWVRSTGPSIHPIGTEHPAHRFEFSHGRDLMVDPLPESGPINFLAYPLMEIEGRPQMVKSLFLFNRADGES